MMKVFRRVVVGMFVVIGTTVVDARVVDAETVEDIDLVTTGDISAWVPPIASNADFQLTIGCEDGEDVEGCEKFTREDLDEGTSGTLTLSFRNHTAGSAPEVARILCPGAASGKRAGVKLRVTGLSAGTELSATFSMESGTGVSQDTVLGPGSLEATGGVQVGVCEKL